MSTVQRKPLAAYLSSTTYGLSDHAWQYTVPYVLHEPRTIFDSYLPVMETAPAAAYQQLFMYYNACNAAADAEISRVKKEHPEPPANQVHPNPNPTPAIPATAPHPSTRSVHFRFIKPKTFPHSSTNCRAWKRVRIRRCKNRKTCYANTSSGVTRRKRICSLLATKQASRVP